MQPQDVGNGTNGFVARLSGSRGGSETEAIAEEVRDGAEAMPHSAEPIPNAAEHTHKIAAALPKKERTETHTFTVQEAKHSFDGIGILISERGVLNWCKPNRKGICILDCGWDVSVGQWFITPESVEAVVRERQAMRQGEAPRFGTSEEKFGNDAELVPQTSEQTGSFSEEQRRPSGASSDRGDTSTDNTEEKSRSHLTDGEFELRKRIFDAEVKAGSYERLVDEMRKEQN